MEEKLTKLQAYKAMIKFLDTYFENTHSDDIGALLSGMQLLPDGETADSAAWEDWIESIKHSLKHPEEGILKFKE